MHACARTLPSGCQYACVHPGLSPEVLPAVDIINIRPDGVRYADGWERNETLVPGTSPVSASTAHPSKRQSLPGNPGITRGCSCTVMLPAVVVTGTELSRYCRAHTLRTRSPAGSCVHVNSKPARACDASCDRGKQNSAPSPAKDTFANGSEKSDDSAELTSPRTVNTGPGVGAGARDPEMRFGFGDLPEFDVFKKHTRTSVA